MNIKRIGAGNRMSEAVILGNRAYLSGFVAEKTVGKSVREQTQDILEQIEATLKEAGTDKTNILKANIWLTDISTFAQMNEAWDRWVVPGKTPARATVESRLAAPGLDVEIMVEAAVPTAAAAGRGAGKAGAARRAAKAGAGGAAARKAGAGGGAAARKAGAGGPAARKAARRAAKKAAKSEKPFEEA